MIGQGDLSKSSIEVAVRSGQRSLEEHEAFSSETVKLAFGRLSTGRISHVSQVSRGLSADAFCPACSERLIARQGRKKAWHFAHANGHACRDALSAAISSWLAQCLNDGESLLLPAIETQWGETAFPDRPQQRQSATEAEAVPIQQGKPYQVNLRTASGGHPLRIMFRTAKTSYTPDIEALRSVGTSTMIIDLYSPLATLLQEDAEREISAAWVTDQLLEKAPRQWLWTMREDTQRETLRRRRLSGHLAALDELTAMGQGGPSVQQSRSEASLDRGGLLHLAEPAPIEGDRFLGPWPRAWRAAIINDLLLDPFSQGLREVLFRDAGFGRRKIVAAIARRSLVRAPQVMRPLARDDEIELMKVAPDLRRPFAIVEDFLAQLARRGYCCASTRKARQMGLPENAIDTRLDGIPDIDWISSATLAQHAMRVSAAETMLR